MKMNFLVFFLLFFFLFLIIYQIYSFYSEYGIEGLTPINPDISGNTVSLDSLQNEVQDLSGNVGNLQTQVNAILQSQNAYLSKNTPAEPNISLQSIS
jgi:cell division protein FtsB